jgi:sterol desaturase/sphingolipid hydroxylase (fatty acid hydroxylase superfamily)
MWIYIFSLTILTILFAEILSYLFHRFLFHKNILNDVRYYHRKHHIIEDDARHDYFIMFAVLIVLTVILIFAFAFVEISIFLALYLFLVAVIYFIINYYIHYSYHNPQSVLQSFFVFRWLKDYHQLHHNNAYCNYAILTPLADYLFFTENFPHYKNFCDKIV